jgi:hypothetical protein
LRRIFFGESLEQHAQLQGKGPARYHLKIPALDSFTTLKKFAEETQILIQALGFCIIEYSSLMDFGP